MAHPPESPVEKRKDFDGFNAENCNEGQIRLLKLEMRKMKSDADNQKMEMENMSKKLSEISVKIENAFGFENQIDSIKAELKMIKER